MAGATPAAGNIVRAANLFGRAARRLLGIALCAAAMAVGGANPPADAGTCGPFGDPPATFISSPKPYCWGGERLGPWNDSDGNPRYACIYEPDSTAATNRLPLLVFIHPSLVSAVSVRGTNLLHYLDSANLSGNPAKPGFILLVPEGRKTTHYYPFPDNRGYGWDNWYRQFNPTGDVAIGGVTYKENVDAAAIDEFIARAITTGKVDIDRIYITGWSNGAAMAYIYALNRPKIAAIAVYSAANPFGMLADPCPQKPVATTPTDNSQIRIFNSGLPIMHLYNSCDTAGICRAAQHLASQLQPLGVEVNDTIIDSFMSRADSCLDSCGTDPNGDASPFSNPLGASLGLLNHVRWPFGWTSEMLDFLRRHPLSARKPLTAESDKSRSARHLSSAELADN